MIRFYYYIDYTRKHLIDFSNGKYAMKYLSSSTKSTIDRMAYDHKEIIHPRHERNRIERNEE